jgi:hypothetical protein
MLYAADGLAQRAGTAAADGRGLNGDQRPYLSWYCRRMKRLLHARSVASCIQQSVVRVPGVAQVEYQASPLHHD